MKNIKYIAFALMLIFVASCTEDFLEVKAPAETGDFIVFGARAGFEHNGNDTRTEYGEETYDDAEGRRFQKVKWINNDAVEILCPEAANGGDVPCPYVVSEDAQKPEYAVLSRVPNAESSLQWGPSEEHTFYAMYPSSQLLNSEEGATVNYTGYLKKEGDIVTMHGVVPNSQSYASYTKVGTTHVYTPNMNYAYMVAKNTVNKNESGDGVKLSFYPLVTALQITLTLPEKITNENNEVVDPVEVPVAEVHITGKGIAGAFTASLNDWDGTGYPTTAVTSTSNETIIYSLWQKDENEVNVPVTIKPGESLQFTVFMAPKQDAVNDENEENITVSNLQIGIYSGQGVLNKTLTGLNVKSHYLTKITNLHLPKVATVEELYVSLEDWLSKLKDDTSIAALSLPGAGGAFSASSTQVNYKEQTLGFDELWKCGIRAFEIASDRPSSTSSSLGNENITVGKQPVSQGNNSNWTVDEVYKAMVDKVTEHPDETAVLILTYQPEDNSPPRDGAGYVSNINAWFTALENASGTNAAKYKPSTACVVFTPSLTLGQARGKVMILARPTSRDEKTEKFDNMTTTLSNKNIVLIDGAGTAKDKWKSRGYKITYGTNTQSAWDISNPYDDNYIMEDYMKNGMFAPTADNTYPTSFTYNNNVTVTRPAQGELLNFNYPTNHKFDCWYQEWQRVADKIVRYNNSVYWFESYSEKLSNAKTTFAMALSGEHNYIFINSLCGYLVRDDVDESRTPSTGWRYGGAYGDFIGLAQKINKDFYNYVLNCGMENTTGPTGVVMMDFVSKDPTAGGSYYLPSVIINNNFKSGYGNVILPDVEEVPGGGTEGGGQGGFQ